MHSHGKHGYRRVMEAGTAATVSRSSAGNTATRMAGRGNHGNKRVQDEATIATCMSRRSNHGNKHVQNGVTTTTRVSRRSNHGNMYVQKK